MFSLFKKTSMQHQILGEITYGFGCWKGNTAKLFESDAVEVLIPGEKSGPSAEAISSLLDLMSCYSSIKNELANTLYKEHYVHGRAAFDAGEFGNEMVDYPIIESPDGIWGNISVIRVWVNSYGKKDQIEIAYGAEWDLEHTLGFIFENNKIINFCASVGP